MIFRIATLALGAAALHAAPLAAQSGPGWAHERPEPGVWSERDGAARHASSGREGRVEVARFRADGAAAAALGQGTVSVVAAPTGAGDAASPELAIYEAAVVDRLAKVGYDVATADPNGGQITELRVLHGVAEPAEAPHKPVSGAMTMGVSNHGSMLGMALAVDLSKPAKALISTRLEARIKDRRSGAVLWEARADIVTRDGDPRWGQQAIAARLAGALFDGFPGQVGESTARR